VSPPFALRASEGEPSFALRSTAGLPSEARRAKDGRALAVRAVLLPLLLAGSLQSARADSLQQLREFLTQTASARGDFSQTSSKGPGSRAQTGGGTFEFERPGRFRWVYTSPYQQTIVSDGTRLYVYDQDLNQVTVKKLKGAIPASPASILFGSNDFERDFQVKSDGEQDGIAWILATPKSKDSSFDRIRIGFRDGLPAAMDLTDSFGQTTQLRFSGVQHNAKIDPARFHFDPPKGADVLEDQ
jgi:outer membrane lipoprotein carrier protein